MFRVIGSSMILQMKQSFARATFKFVVIFQPILYSFLFYFILKNNSEINIGEYIIVSVGLINLWSTIIFSSASDIERERFMGTLEIIYTTPSDFRIIYLGKVIGNIVMGLFSMLLSYLVLSFIFGLDINIQHPLLFSLAMLLTVVSFAVISMLLGYVFTLSRNSRLLMNIMEYPVYILCGIVVPISFLPTYLQWFSYILPPTWAVSILRDSITGIEVTQSFYIHCLILISLSLFYSFLAIIMYRQMDYRTRIKGNLGVH